MKRYELMPTEDMHVKSFYGKAIVEEDDDGNKTLTSYETKVIRIDSDGTLHRLWDDWSSTTGRHVKAFCGLTKKDWDKMEVEE